MGRLVLVCMGPAELARMGVAVRWGTVAAPLRQESAGPEPSGPLVVGIVELRGVRGAIFSNLHMLEGKKKIIAWKLVLTPLRRGGSSNLKQRGAKDYEHATRTSPTTVGILIQTWRKKKHSRSKFRARGSACLLRPAWIRYCCGQLFVLFN